MFCHVLLCNARPTSNARVHDNILLFRPYYSSLYNAMLYYAMPSCAMLKRTAGLMCYALPHYGP